MSEHRTIEPGTEVLAEIEDWTQFVYPTDFIPLEQWHDGPVIAAAGLANSTKLRNLIDRSYYLEYEEDQLECVADQANHFNTGTSVLRAIERSRAENLSLLLDEGVNPNGVPLSKQIDMARRFRRFCYDGLARRAESVRRSMDDMEMYLDDDEIGSVPSQINPPYLTDDELADRRRHFGPFWAVPHCFEIDYSMDEALYHSVVMAGLATPEILDQVLDAVADISAWCKPLPACLPEEADLKPSEACISTPLHTAIATGDNAMLCALFDREISPNARALISGSQALTPMQYAIVIGDLETYYLLRAKGGDPEIRTPVFGVHVLHFAAALLRMDLLKGVGIPLSKASTTAMGHSLLHIAALPFNWSDFENSAPKVKQSIHDERGMVASFRLCERMTKDWDDGGGACQEGQRHLAYKADYESKMEALYRYEGMERLERTKNPKKWTRRKGEDCVQQEAVCKIIVQELGSSEIALPDKHGNTVLHYLAGAKFPNMPLIDWLKSQKNGASAWREATNSWGYTPEELYADAVFARNGPRAPRM
jgi:hypothetical protein